MTCNPNPYNPLAALTSISTVRYRCTVRSHIYRCIHYEHASLEITDAGVIGTKLHSDPNPYYPLAALTSISTVQV